MPPPPVTPIVKPPLAVSLWRTALRFAVILALAFVVHIAINHAMALIETLPEGNRGAAMTGFLIVTLTLYALMIAVPFVPGVEIGFSLLILQGATIAPLVWLGTWVGLTLAFFAGLMLPYSALYRLFLDLRLTSACRLLDEIEPLSLDRRLALLRGRLPGRIGDLAVRFRYVGLALLLNIPGTVVIGGGGGICLVAGLTGLFSRWGMIVTLGLATLPLPLTVWIFGKGVLL